MSNCSDREVTVTVLGVDLLYNPQVLMQKLVKDTRFSKLKKQYKGQESHEHKFLVAVVVEVYKLCETPVAPSQAEGILSLFIAGHCPSIQLLWAAGYIAYEEDEVDSSG